MAMSDMSKCPKLSLLPQHFRDDGTCECMYKEENDAKMLALNTERKRLRAEHKKIVKQIDKLKRKR